MTYRSVSETRWHDGFTVAVRATDVLIEGEPPSSMSGDVVVAISLPSAFGCLWGRGHLVAVQRPAAFMDAGVRFLIAVPFYRLEDRSAAMARLDALLQGC